MKNLLEIWDDLLQSWEDKKIVLMLDYDGTLAPIVEDPAGAVLLAENKDLLMRLLKVPSIQLVILSGRTLVDLKKMVGIEGPIYIGNHGWEIEGQSTHFDSLLPVQLSSMMERIKYELMTQLSVIPGAFVEDKGITLTVHYRRVAPDKEFMVKKVFDQVSMPFRRKNEVRAYRGKKIFELRPPVDWDKGKAALWLLRKQEMLEGKGKILGVYIGDDAADEDVFMALRNKGITVLVGKPENAMPSAARYYLDNLQDVTGLLQNVLDGAEKVAI